MSTKITHCRIQTGHLEGDKFGPACHEGDWVVFSGHFVTAPGPIFTEAPRLSRNCWSDEWRMRQ